MISYNSYNSPESLNKYVKSYWALEGKASYILPYIHRLMADGSAEMVFHYEGIFKEIASNKSEIETNSCGLNAQSRIYRRYIAYEGYGIFGVYLYPYAITHLFSIPATDLSNRHIGLKDIIGKDDNVLIERMLTANSTASRIEIITTFLESKLRKSDYARPGILETIGLIDVNEEKIDIEALAKTNFLSIRQFERNFKTYSGFSPKHYSRIVRFQHSLNYFGAKEKSLTELAFEFGYADQSHFIREFKEFSGYTPKEYFYNSNEGSKWREI